MAEALVMGGLANTVTKLCIVKVEVESVSRELSDMPVVERVASRSERTICSQRAAHAHERGDAIPKQHRRVMSSGQ